MSKWKVGKFKGKEKNEIRAILFNKKAGNREETIKRDPNLSTYEN